MVDLNEKLTQAEVDEIGSALRGMLQGKEVEGVLERAQLLVLREDSQPAANSSPPMEFMVSPRTNSNYFQNFTAHFNNEELIRISANPELTTYEQRFRIISNEGVTSPPQGQSPMQGSPNPGDHTITK